MANHKDADCHLIIRSEVVTLHHLNVLLTSSSIIVNTWILPCFALHCLPPVGWQQGLLRHLKLVLLRSSASETRDTCVRSHVKSTPVQLGLEEILGTSRDTEATPKALFG